MFEVPEAKKILVLGGTGHFGGRICRRLVGEPNTKLIVTSRSFSGAKALVLSLQSIDPEYVIQAAGLLSRLECDPSNICGLHH
jgi:uncharacterized protein YbjT (DUF2867 family)